MDNFDFRSQNHNSLASTSSSSSSFHVHNNNNNNKGKTRDTKRSTTTSTGKLSTDPQSVAARKRRHRISDRFKILQSMVPGGSKMDTVSMLDEAISYVKFLKAQIWLHHNMLLFFNNNEATTSTFTSSSPASFDEFGPVLFGSDDANALAVTDSEYSLWLGLVHDHQEETMHQRGLS